MRRALALTASAALVSACAALVGIDEYTLVDPDGGVDAGGDARADVGEVDAASGDAGADADGGPAFVCAPCNGAKPGLCGLSCDETNPTLITLDGARVLWLANGSTVRAAPSSGATAATTFAALPSPAVAMVATDGLLAWADTAALRANPLDGGAPFFLRPSEPGVSSMAAPPPQLPQGVLFWSTATAIRRCAAAACTSTAVDQIPGQENPTALVAGFDGQNPYGVWLNRGSSTKSIQGAPLVGGIVVTPLAADNLIVPATAIEPTSKSLVFYATSNGSAGQIWQPGVGVVASLPNPIKALAVRGSSVWALAGDFSNPKLGRLVRYDFPGPTKTDLAQGLDAPEAMAVDPTSVYFTVRGSSGAKGAVLRIAR